MAQRRTYGSYNDGCASAHALDLIGERWALIIVRELLLGPKRFADLQRDIVGIGPTVLSQRLRDLEVAGVLTSRPLARPSTGQVYDLTAWGKELEAVNAALSLWAVQSPTMPFDADMSPDTLVLAMRAHIRPRPQLLGERRILLQLNDSRIPNAEAVDYLATVSARETQVQRVTGDAPPTDAQVRASSRDWKACIVGGTELRDLPGIEVTGNRKAVEALIAATRLGA